MRSALEILGCKRVKRMCKVAAAPVRDCPGKWLVLCPKTRQREVESKRYPKSVECFCIHLTQGG